MQQLEHRVDKIEQDGRAAEQLANEVKRLVRNIPRLVEEAVGEIFARRKTERRENMRYAAAMMGGGAAVTGIIVGIVQLAAGGG